MLTIEQPGSTSKRKAVKEAEMHGAQELSLSDAKNESAIVRGRLIVKKQSVPSSAPEMRK
jgi:hypothetical protein